MENKMQLSRTIEYQLMSINNDFFFYLFVGKWTWSVAYHHIISVNRLNINPFKCNNSKRFVISMTLNQIMDMMPWLNDNTR